MDENKRVLFTSLVADLEEECNEPLPVKNSVEKDIVRYEIPSPFDRGDGVGIASPSPAPSFSFGSMNDGETLPSPFLLNAGRWTRGVCQGASPFQQPQRPFQRRQPLQQQPLQDSTHEQELPPGPAPPLPLTMPLRAWINHAKKIQPHPNHTGKLLNWRSKNGGYCKYDKEYLEAAVKVALSLAIKLEHQQKPFAEPNGMVMENILVTNTLRGEAEFVSKSLCNHSQPRNQRIEICAMGRVFFELFTQGAPPPSKIESTSGTSSSTTPHESLLFGNVLRISTDDKELPTGEVDGRSSSRLQRRRCDDPKREQSVRVMLNKVGLPSSICRLVADMLENEADEFGGLFCNEKDCIRTWQDVVLDLQQMVRLGVHDSLLTCWKPTIQNKLYFRDAELKKAMCVAERISRSEAEMEEWGNSHEISHKQHEVLMFSGDAGSGKSRLARELGVTLEQKGWRCLSCKFDRVNPRPLSFILSAFDRYFAKLSHDSRTVDKVANGELIEIIKRIKESISEDNMNILCQLIPSMKYFVSEESIHCEGFLKDQSFDFSDTEGSKHRLHHLFGLLLKVISQKPIMIFMDDLHWADQASLDLITALMHGADEEMFLFAGSFRSNEVADLDPLSVTLRNVSRLSNVTFTEIPLNGLSCNDVNVMVSDALHYPQRLTRSFSKIIHHKSTGNPLFIKELLNDLAVENLLNYSLSSRKWEWDEDLVQARTVSDGVAEILTRRLLRLPDKVLQVLRVLSVFGSSVPMQVLTHVRDVCGIPDVVAELDRPVREGLIQTTTEMCSFVHDMIQQAVDLGIMPRARAKMQKEISEALLAGTSDGRPDAILFILVDLINRVGPDGASSTVDRMRYANLNLIAGEKAIQTPDFGTADSYLESGISFLLGTNYWSDCYNLSLHLFKKSAFVKYAQGDLDLTMKRVHEVLASAKSFDDKLDSLNVLIQVLWLDAKSVSKSIEQNFWVLEQLGESFPATPENDIIAQELVDVKHQLDQLVPSSISNIQPMDTSQKVKAMNFLPMLLTACYQQKSKFFPLVACRMVRLTLQYGLHERSAFGFCSFALAYATVFQDMSEGYKLGKHALAIATKKSIPELYTVMFGALNVWKEPIQCILPELLRANKIGMENGNISFSLVNTMMYSYRAFFSGSKLSSLGKEMLTFLRLYSLYKRHTLTISVAPLANAVAALEGHNRPLAWENMEGTTDDGHILAKSLEVKELNVAETVVICKMMCSFILRDLLEAETVAHQYLDFFERHDSATLNFINIYRYFYGGLIAFDRFRQSESQYWMDIGERAISKFAAWNSECEWNFQNKLMLLQAEHHFATGNIIKARLTYDLAITSSRNHRFPHEEAFSCELAGIFHRSAGRNEQASQLFGQAALCYRSWGASGKADSLSNSAE